MNKELISIASEEYAKDIHEEINTNRYVDSRLDFEAGVRWLLKVQEEQTKTTGFND